MNRIVKTLARRAKWILGIATLLTIAAGYQATHLRVGHDQRKYQPPLDDPVMSARENFRDRFGSGSPLIAALDFGRPLTNSDIIAMDAIASYIRDFDYVESVTGLANAIEFEWSLGRIRPVPLFDLEGPNDTSFERAKRIVAREPMYADILVSKDWTTTALLIDLKKVHHDERNHRTKNRVREIEDILRAFGDDFFTPHITGMPKLNQAFQESARRDVKVFGLLSGVFSVLLLAFLFRRILPVALASGVAAISLVVSLGILATTGTTLSMGLAMIVPLTIVVSVAFSVHYLTQYMRASDIRATRRYLRTMKFVFTPSVIAGVTTALGFASLTASRLESTREIGTYLGLAVVVSMSTSSVLLPALLWTFRFRFEQGNTERMHHRAAIGLGHLVTRRTRSVLLVFVAATIFCGIGLERLDFDANPLELFKEHSALSTSYRLVDEKLGGSVPIDLVVEAKPHEFGELSRRVENAQREIRGLDGIMSAMSAIDLFLIADRNRPSNVDAVARPANGSFPDEHWRDIGDVNVISNFIHKSENEVAIRISTRAKATSAIELRRLLGELHGIVSSLFPGYKATITGQGPVLLRTYDYLVKSQLWAFGLAFVAIFAVVFLFLKKLRVVLTALVANLFPLVAVAGIMGWLHIPLDVATIMIASVALGLIVDDTVHFLYRYTKTRESGMNAIDAAQQTFNLVGPPLATTTIVLLGGFLTLVFSDFLPTSRFGFLTGLAIFAAFLADVVLLPTLLVIGAVQKKSVVS